MASVALGNVNKVYPGEVKAAIDSRADSHLVFHAGEDIALSVFIGKAHYCDTAEETVI